jgi:hypothetical protein
MRSSFDRLTTNATTVFGLTARLGYAPYGPPADTTSEVNL